jgi:hypothetical protein
MVRRLKFGPIGLASRWLLFSLPSPLATMPGTLLHPGKAWPLGRFFDFFDFQFLTTEYGLAKDQSSKGVLLYFHVFLCGNECLN